MSAPNDDAFADVPWEHRPRTDYRIESMQEELDAQLGAPAAQCVHDWMKIGPAKPGLLGGMVYSVTCKKCGAWTQIPADANVGGGGPGGSVG